MSESKKYTVVISDRAKRMLGAYILFHAHASKDAARKQKQEIMTALRSLAQMPQRFSFLEKAYITPNQYRRMFIERRYLVLYQIQENTVYAEHIVDRRQDYSWLLP